MANSESKISGKRPVPTGGVGVKKMPSKRNKNIKIKKLLDQA